LLRIAAGTAAALVVALLAAWLALRHVPAWYRPVAVPPDQLQRVRDSVTEAFRDVSDRIVVGQSFDRTFTAEQLTEWLVARADIWPEAGGWLPPWLRDPVIAFEPGRIILAAHLDRDGWEAIVALHLSVQVEKCPVTPSTEPDRVGPDHPAGSSTLDAPVKGSSDEFRVQSAESYSELATLNSNSAVHPDSASRPARIPGYYRSTDRQQVVLRLESVTVGAVPVPADFLADRLDGLIRSLHVNEYALPDQAAAALRKLRTARAESLLSDGLRLPGPFIWKNGRRPYDVEAIRITPDRLTVRIRPR